VSGLSPETKASWRRFWRYGPPTPRQTGDAALARLAAAEELAEDPADFNNLADPYDYKLAEIATDPSLVQFDKARRVHAGQTARRLKRRLNANKRRRSY
jgi:hypothetical protein